MTTEAIQTLDQLNQPIEENSTLHSLANRKRLLPTDDHINRLTPDNTFRHELRVSRNALILKITERETELTNELKGEIQTAIQVLADTPQDGLPDFVSNYQYLEGACLGDLKKIDLYPLREQLKTKLEILTETTPTMSLFFYDYFKDQTKELEADLHRSGGNAELLQGLASRFTKLKQDITNNQNKIEGYHRDWCLRGFNKLASSMVIVISTSVNFSQFPELQSFNAETASPGIEAAERQQELAVVTPFYDKIKAIDEGATATLIAELRQSEKEYLLCWSTLDEYQSGIEAAALDKARFGLSDNPALSQLLKELKITVLQLGVPLVLKKLQQKIFEGIDNAQNLTELFEACGNLPQTKNPKFKQVIDLYSADKKSQYLNALKQGLIGITEKIDRQEDLVNAWQGYLKLLPGLTIAASLAENKDSDAIGVTRLRTAIVKAFRDLIKKDKTLFGPQSNGLYLDDAYWLSLQKEIEACDADELSVIAAQLLETKPEIQQAAVEGELKYKLIQDFNETVAAVVLQLWKLNVTIDECEESLKKFHADSSPQASLSIELAERHQEMVVLTPFIEPLKDLLKTVKDAGEDTRMLDMLLKTFQKRDYQHCLLTGAEYRNELIRDIKDVTDELKEPEEAKAAWDKIAADLVPKVYLLGLDATIITAYNARLEALKQADSLEVMALAVHVIPQELDVKRKADWVLALKCSSKPQWTKLRSKLEKELTAILAETNDTDMPSPEHFQRYLDIRSELNAEDEPVDLLFRQRDVVARFKKAVTKEPTADAAPPSPAMQAFKMDAFAEGFELGRLDNLVKYNLDEEDLALHAREFAEAKAKFATAKLSGDEALSAIKALNKVANSFLEVVAKRPMTGAEEEDLAVFYDKDSYPGIEIKERCNELATLDVWLETIKTKKASLEKDGHQEAAIAAQKLLTMTNTYSRGYVQGLSSPDDFKAQMDDALSSAHHHLDKHRGWKQLLINLALAIFTFGVGYLAVALYQGRFFPALHVATKSEQMLDDFEVAVKGMGAAAGA